MYSFNKLLSNGTFKPYSTVINGGSGMRMYFDKHNFTISNFYIQPGLLADYSPLQKRNVTMVEVSRMYRNLEAIGMKLLEKKSVELLK